jgi:glycerol-3-phosphate acyltransferase PlsY
MNMNEFFTNLQDQPWILLPVAAVVGYLLGSISTARVIYFLSTGSRDYTPFTEVNSAGEEYEVDLVSATWVSKKLGKRYGCFTAVLDMLKVGLPTLLFKLLFTAHPYFLLVALAGMAGHNYPLYHGFKGGRGESPMIGVLLVINWFGLILANGVASVLGYILGSIMVLRWSSYFLLIFWYWFYFQDIYYVVFMLLANFLFWFSMRKDMISFQEAKKRGVTFTEEELSEFMMMGRSMGRFMDNYGLINLLKRRGKS